MHVVYDAKRQILRHLVLLCMQSYEVPQRCTCVQGPCHPHVRNSRVFFILQGKHLSIGRSLHRKVVSNKAFTFKQFLHTSMYGSCPLSYVRTCARTYMQELSQALLETCEKNRVHYIHIFTRAQCVPSTYMQVLM
jgi:hypothetical protein